MDKKKTTNFPKIITKINSKSYGFMLDIKLKQIVKIKLIILIKTGGKSIKSIA
jgi:hypothetical protein